MCGVSAVGVTIPPVNGPKLNPESSMRRGAPKGTGTKKGIRATHQGGAGLEREQKNTG